MARRYFRPVPCCLAGGDENLNVSEIWLWLSDGLTRTGKAGVKNVQKEVGGRLGFPFVRSCVNVIPLFALRSGGEAVRMNLTGAQLTFCNLKRAFLSTEGNALFLCIVNSLIFCDGWLCADGFRLSF